VLYLDTALTLTHGSPIKTAALFGRLSPVIGAYSNIYSAPDCYPPLIGQMHYTPGERSAHLTSLMPKEDLDTPDLSLLLEDLARQAGVWGAFHLLAEVEEHSAAVEQLRQSGFGVVAWQRIYRFDLPAPSKKCKPALWRTARSLDDVAVRNLFSELVPPLVQVANPFTSVRSPARVYLQDGVIVAYVEIHLGPQGIYISPLIHPEVHNVNELLQDLLFNEPRRAGLPVYFAIPSYQGWLETCMEEQKGQASDRHAIMVKHLATLQRALQAKPAQAVLEKYKVEPTAPIVNSSAHSLDH
jgi:hypothetical protein